ncbi:hypothetical protein [Kitasatospora sp. NPDC048407]
MALCAMARAEVNTVLVAGNAVKRHGQLLHPSCRAEELRLRLTG